MPGGFYLRDVAIEVTSLAVDNHCQQKYQFMEILTNEVEI